MNTREWVIGHHSDIAHDGKAQLSRINNGHERRGFPISKLGFYVGYHFVVEETGDWIQTRGLDERGAHADNCGCPRDQSGVPKGMINFRSIGICLAGKFDEHPPKDAQISAMHTIIWSLQQNYGSVLLLHREVKATSCPVADLRTLYNQEHEKYLLKELEQKRNALKWATGARRSLLEHSIARLLSTLLPSP